MIVGHRHHEQVHNILLACDHLGLDAAELPKPFVLRELLGKHRQLRLRVETSCEELFSSLFFVARSIPSQPRCNDGLRVLWQVAPHRVVPP